jgi:hypothetical protein
MPRQTCCSSACSGNAIIVLQRANAKGIFLFIFVSWVIIEQHYHNNEMVFLFIASQLTNIETVFYFITLLYSGVKKTGKAVR